MYSQTDIALDFFLGLLHVLLQFFEFRLQRAREHGRLGIEIDHGRRLYRHHRRGRRLARFLDLQIDDGDDGERRHRTRQRARKPEPGRPRRRDGFRRRFRRDAAQRGVDAAIEKVVALAIPVQPLCREECRGLCPQCGVDRNRETCDCAAPRDASPFAVLATLKE